MIHCYSVVPQQLHFGIVWVNLRSVSGLCVTAADKDFVCHVCHQPAEVVTEAAVRL